MHARNLRSTRVCCGYLMTVAAIAGVGYWAVRAPANQFPDPANQSLPSLQGGGRIEICHCPPGNPNNCRTITIDPIDLPAHLAHGDSLGPCFGEAIPLSAEDIALIRQIVNEILVRVSEIDRIFASTGGTPPIGLVRKFCFSTEGYDKDGNPTTVDIEMEPITIIGNPKGCSKDPPGICCECPCP